MKKENNFTRKKNQRNVVFFLNLYQIIITNLLRNIELTSSCVIEGFFELAARIENRDLLMENIGFGVNYPFEMVEHNSQQVFLIDEHILVHFQPD
jgi:hypothetical protein